MRFFRDFFDVKLNGSDAIFCLIKTSGAMLLEPPAAQVICGR